ncbi:hypothetical protein GCM10009745_23360 [Kribbella yunnanensis]|uniref:Uncharacterized protein n=1 Tax=Kribbella yunnanensis TaxID=190194 RepID=A0ABN2GZ81_9ACTN
MIHTIAIAVGEKLLLVRLERQRDIIRRRGRRRLLGFTAAGSSAGPQPPSIVIAANATADPKAGLRMGLSSLAPGSESRSR